MMDQRLAFELERADGHVLQGEASGWGFSNFGTLQLELHWGQRVDRDGDVVAELDASLVHFFPLAGIRRFSVQPPQAVPPAPSEPQRPVEPRIYTPRDMS